MKKQLQHLFMQALARLESESMIPAEQSRTVIFERARQKDHGDFATNIAMTLAKAAGRNPRELAQLIVDALPHDQLVSKVAIAGPGFINIWLAEDARNKVIESVLKQGRRYGLAPANSKSKIMVEFVSANPTGPLHVGHGRGACYGDALARLLTAAGNSVEREYYVNDAGRQMDILAVSVWFRYMQALGAEVTLPDNCYQGEYVVDMGLSLARQHGETYMLRNSQLETATAGEDDEETLDAVIQLLKHELGSDGFAVFFELALNTILADIKHDLSDFGINYDTWFSERSLFTDGKIAAVVEQLKTANQLYEKGGAWWFRATSFGDEKDRVVVRENGQPTYFASDIAYHKDKLDRGFDLCINIWGSDHHGYIPRVKASLQALGSNPDQLTVLLVQFAVLYRGGEQVSMSTRSGQFVTLRELREEVGSDAARFFYVQRKSEQHMDFDLDLAKSQSNDNPLYYVQYAHARICSIFRQAAQRDIDTGNYQAADLSLLGNEQEHAIIALLERFPEVIDNAARSYEPHQMAYFLRELATVFHSYYNTEKFLDAEASKRDSMLALCAATCQVLANGLAIIGVDAPERM